MPFEITDTPGLYSDTMTNFKEEWDMLFIETLCKIVTLINKQVTVTETDELFIGDKEITSGIRTTINDILLLCSNLGSIMVYLECVCKVFQK